MVGQQGGGFDPGGVIGADSQVVAEPEVQLGSVLGCVPVVGQDLPNTLTQVLIGLQTPWELLPGQATNVHFKVACARTHTIGLDR